MMMLVHVNTSASGFLNGKNISSIQIHKIKLTVLAFSLESFAQKQKSGSACWKLGLGRKAGMSW